MFTFVYDLSQSAPLFANRRVYKLFANVFVYIRLIVNEGKTLLASDEVEMLGVLRINRKFMELMRTKYKEQAKQQFNKTVVDEPAFTTSSQIVNHREVRRVPPRDRSAPTSVSHHRNYVR